ncbi:MAG: TMEM254 family protein [Polyangiales bacterium]
MQGQPRLERPALWCWVAVLGGMGMLGVLALSASAYALWSEHVTAALSQGLLQSVFAVAVALHVAEAFIAHRLARRIGERRAASAWFWQTFLLGYFSLGLLRRRARERTPRVT